MEGHKGACLNCGAILLGAYCHNCGQRADTHRITLPHLVKHDLVHGIWHFDKGLLYTLREAFLRPGHMAMDYIKGKRIKYYNVFYLILIVLGINVLTVHFFRQYYHITEEAGTNGLVLHEDSADISYYVRHYYKLILFLVIPFFALCGFISFRRIKLNFAEHAIIGGSLLLTGAIWYLLVTVGIYSSMAIESEVFNYLVWGAVIITWLQPVRIYYQAFHKEYTTAGFVLRILLWYVCLAALSFMVLLAIAALTGKKNITLS